MGTRRGFRHRDQIMRRAARGGAAVAVAGAAFAVQQPLVRAADITANWQTNATGNWSEAAKWSSGTVPNNFPGPTTYDVIQNSGSLTVDNAYEMNTLSVGGTGTLGIDTNNALYVEVNPTTISGSAHVNVTATLVGPRGKLGTVGLNLSGGQLNINGAEVVVDPDATQAGPFPGLFIGISGPASATVSGGAILATDLSCQSAVGASPGATGTLTLTGSGSRWNDSGVAAVGYQTTGTLNIQSAAVFSSEGVGVGQLFGGNGTVNLTGTGSRWEDAFGVAIGVLSTGHLVVSGGGTYVANHGTAVGRAIGGVGTVLVTGTGSSFTDNFGMSVGGSSAINDGLAEGGGVGSLNVASGASCVVNAMEIGGDPGSTGSVDVRNTGSTFTSFQGVGVGGNNFGPRGSGSFVVGSGATVFGGGVFRVYGTSGTFATVEGGTFSATSLEMQGGLFNYTGGSVSATAATLTAGGRMLFSSGKNKTFRANSVSIDSASKIDISDNRMILKTQPVGTWNGTTYTDVSGLIRSGRNGGNWSGGGIVTSQTAATTGNFTSIGVATAAQAKLIASTATVVWNGQTVTGSDTLVLYTYGGDANLDGKLNVDDYGRIDSNIALGTAGWYNGDFNYDGKVNVDDYGIIDSNIGIQGPPFSSAVAATAPAARLTAVPEPTAPGVLMTALLLSSRRRRRMEGRR
jgi:T5SS/PEP-CTERM-associated repeat protein